MPRKDGIPLLLPLRWQRTRGRSDAPEPPAARESDFTADSVPLPVEPDCFPLPDEERSHWTPQPKTCHMRGLSLFGGDEENAQVNSTILGRMDTVAECSLDSQSLYYGDSQGSDPAMMERMVTISTAIFHDVTEIADENSTEDRLQIVQDALLEACEGFAQEIKDDRNYDLLTYNLRTKVRTLFTYDELRAIEDQLGFTVDLAIERALYSAPLRRQLTQELQKQLTQESSYEAISYSGKAVAE